MVDAGFARLPASSVGPGRHGKADGPPGVLVQELDGREIVGIAARRGRIADVTQAVQRRWNVTLPPTPRFVCADAIAFAWAGAGQWLAQAPSGSLLEQELRSLLDGMASMTAQGDGRVVVQVRGPAVREVLATGIPIDLHPRAFTTGQTAITLAGQIGIRIRQLDDAPTYELVAFRGFADDLIGWLIDAGRAHGVEVMERG